MSTTKKDGTKPTSTRKQPTHASKTTTKTREDSTDRRHIKKVEDPLKNKVKQSSVTNAKQKTVSSSRLENSVRKEKIVTKKVSTNVSKKSSDVVSSDTKRKMPGTPTSQRVSKSQFFPTKDMYSNALKTTEGALSSSRLSVRDKPEKKIEQPIKSKQKESSQLSSRAEANKRPNRVIDEIRARRLNMKNATPRKPPPEKILPDISPDSSTISERPRTATLRKGSIVNTNIVGPEVPKELTPKLVKKVLKTVPSSSKSDKSDDDNYEDDFESYESDFEECSSSSSYDGNSISGEETSSVSSDRSDSIHSPAPQETSTSQKRISSASTDEEKKMDSGNFDLPDYKHRQILDNIKESVEKENANISKQEVQRNNPASLSDEGFEDQKSLQFINFVDAKKKYEQRKNMETKRKRAEQILGMIRLDTFSFTLFDLPPVPYETFIKNYGSSNTVQTATQTGEDDVDEEIQTEEIVCDTRWTQIPVSFSKTDTEHPDFWQIYRAEYLGVGREKFEHELANKPYNDDSLNRFLFSAGKLIINLQDEAALERTAPLKKNSRDIPFSEGFVQFNTESEALKNSKVQYVSFCCDNSKKLLTVHSTSNDLSSVIAVWNISCPETPDEIVVSYGLVKCCTFGADSSNYIYAGLYDGTICVWESKKTLQSSQENYSSRIPIHSTSIALGHYTKVVALHPVTSSSEENSITEGGAAEICSLDEEGEIILWSVIVKVPVNTSYNTDVVLVKNTTVSLKVVHPEITDLQCTDFVLSPLNSNFAFISTNYGFIVHHLVKGGRTNVKKFICDDTSTANCLDSCPFSTDHFVAGFANGNINLYSTAVEKPLMVLSDKESTTDSCSIELIQWSKNKPFVIYTKDKSNTLHIWDLNESDMFPIYSIPFEKDITCMKLSPSVHDSGNEKSYMVIGTENGFLYLHELNKEHAQQSKEVFNEHVSTFKNYVNRL